MSGALDLLYHPRQMILFVLSRSQPRSKVSHLAVISIIGKPHLWSNQQYLAVQTENPAIITNVSMLYRHSYVEENTMTFFIHYVTEWLVVSYLSLNGEEFGGEVSHMEIGVHEINSSCKQDRKQNSKLR